MATLNNTSKRPILISKASDLPSLGDRVKSKIFPRHLGMGVHFGDEVVMHFHTSGTDAIWSIPVTEAAINERLIKGLSPEDALQVGIFWQKQRNKQLTSSDDCIKEIHHDAY